MKMPETFEEYCPHCRKRGKHKAKMYKKGSTRKTAEGQARHVEKGKGYGAKTAGKVQVYKQAKHPTLMLTCPNCGKKHPKTIGGRTKKVLELTK